MALLLYFYFTIKIAHYNVVASKKNLKHSIHLKHKTVFSEVLEQHLEIYNLIIFLLYLNDTLICYHLNKENL
jgi:hypothetical protein